VREGIGQRVHAGEVGRARGVEPELAAKAAHQREAGRRGGPGVPS
jgi:hypothetical protein